ncbi:MAG: penicillin-binding protein 2 [Alistipes sp.]|nr:penicillin-binding protein 2 [Alistipes sp.]
MKIQRDNRLRKLVARGVVCTIFALFLARVGYLQFIDGRYDDLASNNYLRYVVTYPPRGEVFDRNGEYLIQNRLCYDLMVVRRDMPKSGIDTMRLAEITHLSLKQLRKSFADAASRPRLGMPVAKYLTPEDKLRLDEWNIPGFYTVPRTVRQYPRKIGGNLLGSLSEIQPWQLQKYAESGYYAIGDYIGEQGLESAYEEVLRGEKGLVLHDLYAIDNSNDQTLKEPVPGKALICTIDARLQAFAEELMAGKVGSVVAIEPSTGEILVMASSPTFDPDQLVGRDRGNNYMHLLNNEPRRPLINRAIKSSQPPGSTFKLVNGLIGLQEGVLKPHYRYSCNCGYTYAKNKKMGCHEHASPLNLDFAIATSCNAYFCNVYRNILENKKFASSKDGYEVWRDYVMSFGFGTNLETDFYGERRGQVMDREFYDKRYRRSWNALTVLSLSIGQGELECTSLQLANFAATLANRGYYYTPHIVRSYEGCDSLDARFYRKNYTKVDSRHFETIVKGMWRGVNVDGTCRGAALPGLDVCGKTGTAQNPKGDDHSTFISFAPRNNPRIAIAVYVEHGGFGASAAVPIASLIEELYLTDTIKRPHLVDYVKTLKLDYFKAYDRHKSKK